MRADPPEPFFERTKNVVGTVVDVDESRNLAWLSVTGSFSVDQYIARLNDVTNSKPQRVHISEIVSFTPLVETKHGKYLRLAKQLRILAGLEEKKAMHTPVMQDVRGFSARRAKR